ncbi:MFS transporter [Amnibacterium kyonggiense]|uniref:MFS transporter n=1 Tax=Amnibacterium kyonggiense TaxID=595671 RepID=A0A4R7FRM1_9MICO|nr:MFS transporter [Amnibacterium kyonggiense]TDS80475.1 MFS transporter [Amnibacterium kyonggiense]
MTVVEPAVRVGARWIGGFAVAWLGVWLAQLTVIQLLLPAQVAGTTGEHGFVDTIMRFGWVSAAAGVAALIAFPVVGALSDATVSRFGRRRPWIAVGTALFAAGLLLLGLQTSVVGIALAWCVALAGFAAVSSALTALIADQVPVEQRGVVSAFVSVPQAAGTILGLLLVEALALSRAGSYALVALVLVVLVVPLLLRIPDAPASAPAARPGIRQMTASLWIDPRTHPDFAWTLTGRLLVNLGNALGTSLLLYWLADGLGDPHAEDDLIPLVLVYLVALVVASLVAGRASDRTGRRRAFVGAAAALQAVAGLLLALVPSYGTTLVGGALLGAGYGVFLAVDQALATQVLPDPQDRGKDLGIMNVALAVPQAFGPIVGAALIVASGGFGALFVGAGVLSALGAVSVSRVRGVA